MCSMQGEISRKQKVTLKMLFLCFSLLEKECFDLNRTLSKLIKHYRETETASNIFISVRRSYVSLRKGQLNDDRFNAELGFIPLSSSPWEEHSEAPTHMLHIHRETHVGAKSCVIRCYSRSTCSLRLHYIHSTQKFIRML